MTGLPTLLVELDDPAGSGTWPYDITKYVDLRAVWSLTRGRQDELGEVDPATLRMTLNNRDGRFTLGSPVYGGLVVDQRLRVTETMGATTSRRVTGYVQDWPVEFVDAGARNVPCKITVTDRQARLNRSPLPEPVKFEALAAAPYAYYPMSDEPGATTSADYSGNTRPTLKVAGSGATFVAGSEGAAGTGFLFAGGTYLRSDHPSFVCDGIGVWFTAPTRPASQVTLVQVSSTNADSVSVYLDVTGTVYAQRVANGALVGDLGGFTDLCDGKPHFVVALFPSDGSVQRFYVDGAEVVSVTNPAFAAAAVERIVMGFRVSGVTMSNLAAYSGTLPTAAQVQAQYLSVLSSSEDSDDRFARIARYAGVPAGDLALEPGVLRSTAPQSLEKEQAATGLSAVSEAEGGTWFVRGDGKVVSQNRVHRTLKASQPPAVQLASDDVNHDDLVITADKQYLQNVVSGSRPDGATQESRSDASVASYGVYPGDFNGLLVTTDAEVKDRLDWQVNSYGQPMPRLNRVKIDLLSLPAAKVAALLALEIGDRVTISGLPAQSPILTADLLVEGSEETQSQDAWNLALNTVSASLFRAWILGDSVYGVLGSTTRTHY